MRIETCIHCGEPIERGVPGTGVALHRECQFRLIAGGVNHQLGQCICCGGTMEPDPPHMTLREAARAAIELWELRAKAKAGEGRAAPEMEEAENLREQVRLLLTGRVVDDCVLALADCLSETVAMRSDSPEEVGKTLRRLIPKQVEVVRQNWPMILQMKAQAAHSGTA